MTSSYMFPIIGFFSVGTLLGIATKTSSLYVFSTILGLSGWPLALSLFVPLAALELILAKLAGISSKQMGNAGPESAIFIGCMMIGVLLGFGAAYLLWFVPAVTFS